MSRKYIRFSVTMKNRRVFQGLEVYNILRLICSILYASKQGLKSNKLLVRLYFYGESPVANILVMELLGPTIEGLLLKYFSEILMK